MDTFALVTVIALIVIVAGIGAGILLYIQEMRKK